MNAFYLYRKIRIRRVISQLAAGVGPASTRSQREEVWVLLAAC